MIAEIPILWQKIAPVLLLAALIVLSGCATLTEQQIYMDWIAIANPAAICAGAPDCVQHSTYRGKKMCTIVTADKNVSYARLGEQIRDCMRSPEQHGAQATEVEHRRE